MAQFTVNPTRFDPYKNFKFRIRWGNTPYIAGVSKITALKRTTEVIEHREGGDPSSVRKMVGRHKFEPLTLERGITHDHEFERWANKVWSYANAQAPPEQRTLEMSLADFRRNLFIDVFNEAGQKVISYRVYRCWVSEYQALPDLDANANAVAIEMLKIEHEGFERDESVTEPAQPVYEQPPV